MIGNSLPDSRKNAACVPPTLVRIESATPVTERPSSAALGRSTWIAISGRPASRPTRALRTSGTLSMTALAAWARVSACLRSSPRISSEMRLSPPPMMRFICELPPEARVVMITPGQDAGQLPVQIAGDRLAGARPLAPRHQSQRHVGPVGAAAHRTRRRPPA